MNIDQAISSWSLRDWPKEPFQGSEGEGDPNPAGGDGGTGDPKKPEGEGKPPEGDKPVEGDEKKFTQDEVNAIVSREVNQKLRGKLDPKEAGFESAKELRDFLEEMKQKRESEKTDAEKEKEEAIKQAAKEAEDKVLSKANSRLVRAEFSIQASKHKVAYIDDAFEIAQTLEIWAPEIDEEKESVSGFDDKFFEDLKKAKPYLFEAQKTTDIGAGAGGGGGDKGAQREAELEKAYPTLGRIAQQSRVVSGTKP